jgi:Na+/melibiose symporter-like transporter
MSFRTMQSTVKKTITAYPTVFGLVIGLMLIGAIFVIVIWFPRIGDVWDRHDKTVRSVWCTLALFVVCLYSLSGWRHRRGFWLAISTFFALHIASVVFYSTYVHPLLLREWVVLLLVEAAVIAFGLDWLLEHLSDRKLVPRENSKRA